MRDKPRVDDVLVLRQRRRPEALRLLRRQPLDEELADRDLLIRAPPAGLDLPEELVEVFPRGALRPEAALGVLLAPARAGVVCEPVRSDRLASRSDAASHFPNLSAARSAASSIARSNSTSSSLVTRPRTACTLPGRSATLLSRSSRNGRPQVR